MKVPMEPTNDLDEETDDEVEAESERLNFEKPDFKFEEQDHHEWRQQGPYLVCKDCNLTHAIWIGMDKMLVGFNKQGEPILMER